MEKRMEPIPIGVALGEDDFSITGKGKTPMIRRPEISKGRLMGGFIRISILRIAMITACLGVMIMIHGPRPALAEDPFETLTVIGYVEMIRLPDYDFDIKAKIDTGARSSSIDARDKVFFKKDGKDWVRFRILNNGGEDHILEMPIHRYVRIRRAGTEMVRRPIVRLRICFAGEQYLIDVNLTQRPQMNYRMLLGRKFLNGRFVIDPQKTFLTKPGCKRVSKP